MIPRAHITAWRARAPWPDDAQVEQDLVLSRALVEIFSEASLSKNLALRGGTAYHKVFLATPARYSEDIDLVQTVEGPIGPILDAIRDRLDSWLGKPRHKKGEGGTTLSYKFDSEVPPVRPLRVKLEVNTREQFTVFGHVKKNFSVSSPWFTATSEVVTYELDELQATKLRALYQRKKGRDLYDLWLALTRGGLDAKRVVQAFVRYLERDGTKITRAEFEENLAEKLDDPAFERDLKPLLGPGVIYDPREAHRAVFERLLSLL